MSVKSVPWEVGVAGLLLLGSVAACVGVVGPGGYDGAVAVGYTGGYYEPYVATYGGWGHGYNVAPPRSGDHGNHGDHGGHGGPPSIPNRPPQHH
ncbi:MAG: hypothetical protein ACLPX1_13765 [Steroidobacteraceae bacterium]